MPAPSSSIINAAIGHLAELAADTAGDPPGLLTVLAGVADPGAGGECGTGCW
jgi:hypothetical protein